MNPESFDHVTMPEAAKLLRVSLRFLQLEEKRGKLHVLKLSPKCVRIRKTELERYIQVAFDKTNPPE